MLANGNVLVGWGAQPYVSEFTPDGTLVFDAKLGPGYVSYRAYRAPWNGEGEGLPAVALERASGYTDAYVSWNGDTRVARWTVLGGRRANNLVPIGSVPRTGFETGVRIPARFTNLRLVGSDVRRSRARRLARRWSAERSDPARRHRDQLDALVDAEPRRVDHEVVERRVGDVAPVETLYPRRPRAVVFALLLAGLVV